MKHFLVVLLVCFSGVAAASDTNQIVPPEVLSAKTILPFVYYPDATASDRNEVRWEADRFLTKWHRFDVIYEADADIVAYIVVEPMTVYPGFWQRVSWGVAASQAGTHCTAQSYGTTATADCYTTPVPAALTPGLILRGSILIFDGGEFHDWLRRGAKDPLPRPIMSALADGHGSRPLIGAGKKLRKMIDDASRTAQLRTP